MSWQGLCYVDENLAIINEVNGRPITTLNLSPFYLTNRAQRWVLNLPLEPTLVGPALGMITAAMFEANYEKLITLPMPQVVDMTVGQLASRYRTGTASARASSVDVRNADAIPIGRFISFSNHAKVYIVTGRGAGSIGIFPTLRTAIVAPIDMNVVPNLVSRQVSDVMQVVITRKISRIRIRLAENI